MSISQYINNWMMQIDDSSEDAYYYGQRDSRYIALTFLLSIVLEVITRVNIPAIKPFIQNYLGYITLGYGLIVLLLMILLSGLRKQDILKKREELLNVFQIVRPLITSAKDAEIDYNNPGFELEYKYGNVNKINVPVEPTKFSSGVDKVLTPIVAQLNAFLPTYSWNYESHLEERYLTLVGSDKPPELARWPGSWLRHFRFMPVGISGKGEVAYQPDSVPKKEYGRSLYLNEKGDPIPTDTSLPTQPQALVCGAPLGLGTIIPTTQGYRTMETIEIGDEVFDLHNKPVRVLGKSEVNYDPEKVYKLTFRRKADLINIVSDEIHKFPKVVTEGYEISTVEELKIGDNIVANNGKQYKLTRKKIIEKQPVQCILVDSNDHLFLVTDKEDIRWKGGDHYPYNAVYTRNTGGGKAIWVDQELYDE